MCEHRRCSCQNSCSIYVYFVPTAVCTRVLYTLIVTVQLSFLSDRSEHCILPGDTTHTHITQSQMLSSGSPTKNMAELRRLNIINQSNKHYFTKESTFNLNKLIKNSTVHVNKEWLTGTRSMMKLWIFSPCKKQSLLLGITKVQVTASLHNFKCSSVQYPRIYNI